MKMLKLTIEQKTCFKMKTKSKVMILVPTPFRFSCKQHFLKLFNIKKSLNVCFLYIALGKMLTYFIHLYMYSISMYMYEQYIILLQTVYFSPQSPFQLIHEPHLLNERSSFSTALQSLSFLINITTHKYQHNLRLFENNLSLLMYM